MQDDTLILDTFRQSLPVNVFGLARALGLRVQTTPLSTSGSMTRLGKSWVITINANDGPQRQRFTLAHMIAHYYLHRDLMGSGVHVDTLYDTAAAHNPSAPLSPYHDTQANRFAVDILMPIPQMHATATMTIEDQAKAFGVSQAAITIRRKQLPTLLASH